MNLFKHTRSQDYSSVTPSSPTACQSYPTPAAPIETERPEIDQPGFFSNEPELGNPTNWIPGFITSIDGNRFSMRDMKKNENKFRFFIPAKLFDPEAGYVQAKTNVYQVIFGKQVTKRLQVNVTELSGDNIPESFKKWAQLKNSNISAPAPAAPVPHAFTPTKPIQTPSEIRVSPDFTLRVGSRYLFSNDPSNRNSFREATLLVLMPDRMVTTDGEFTFVLNPAKAGKTDWKKYVISTKPQPGAPIPPQGLMPQSEPQSMTDAIKEKKEGRAGIERPLMEGDTIVVFEGADKTNRDNWYPTRFLNTTENKFNTTSGRFSLAIPKDIVDDVGYEDAIRRFILKVVDNEIKPLNS